MCAVLSSWRPELPVNGAGSHPDRRQAARQPSVGPFLLLRGSRSSHGTDFNPGRSLRGPRQARSLGASGLWPPMDRPEPANDKRRGCLSRNRAVMSGPVFSIPQISWLVIAVWLVAPVVTRQPYLDARLDVAYLLAKLRDPRRYARAEPEPYVARHRSARVFSLYPCPVPVRTGGVTLLTQ